MEQDTPKREAITPDQHGRVREHLDRVLLSTPFAGSPRSRSFLKYVVEESLRGNAGQIKERNIAVDVFGKNCDFDTQEQSTVRVAAGEVRRRLLQTYESGLEDGVRIELPVGSYCPKFSVNSLARLPQPSAAIPAVELASYRGTRLHRRVSFRWIAAAAALILLSIALFMSLHRTRQPLDDLWSVFTAHRQPVVLVLPAPSVVAAETLASSTADTDPLPTAALHPDGGGYTGMGAGLGAARVAEQLAKRNQQFVLRTARNASYGDLHAAPTILFGATTSGIGMQMTSSLRFRIADGVTEKAIVDTVPGGRTWSVSKRMRTDALREGYALITFLRKTPAGFPILIVAGLNPADTQAAAQFITDGDSLRDFARSAPRDWADHSFQLVLHENIFEGSPDRSVILSEQSW